MVRHPSEVTEKLSECLETIRSLQSQVQAARRTWLFLFELPCLLGDSPTFEVYIRALDFWKLPLVVLTGAASVSSRTLWL